MKTSNTQKHEYIDRTVAVQDIKKQAQQMIASQEDEDTKDFIRYTAWLQVKAFNEAVPVPVKFVTSSYWITGKRSCECAACGSKFRIWDALDWSFCPKCGASIEK